MENKKLEKIRKLITAGMLEKAKRECKFLIEAGLNDFEKFQGYRNLGYVLMEQKETKAAIIEINRALALGKGHETYIEFGHLAMCYYRIGDINLAQEYVDKAIESAEIANHWGGKYEWYNYKALILLKLGQYSEALIYTEKSLNSIPADYVEKEIIEAKNYLMVLYFPVLTEFRIYLAQNNLKEASKRYERLHQFFSLIEKPTLHLIKDLNKFQSMEKKYKENLFKFNGSVRSLF
jgi:tetratricopeptide (TPR) repeat protein